MKEKQKLYTKLPNGRYQEYKEPQRPDGDNALYSRVGKKYVPHSIHLSGDFDWQEGVFAVTKNHSATNPDSWTSAEYLQKIFNLYKCGDIENVSIARLGGMNKLAHHLARHWEEISGDSVYEKAASIVAILMNYENEKT